MECEFLLAFFFASLLKHAMSVVASLTNVYVLSRLFFKSVVNAIFSIRCVVKIQAVLFDCEEA